MIPIRPKVYLVDDEPELRRALERVLRAEGFAVGHVGDGKREPPSEASRVNRATQIPRVVTVGKSENRKIGNAGTRERGAGGGAGGVNPERGRLRGRRARRAPAQAAARR